MYTHQAHTNHAFKKSLLILTTMLLLAGIASLFPVLVTVLILSGLLSFLLKPLVHYGEYRIGMKRSITILLLFIILGLCLFFSSILLFPLLLERAQTLYRTFQSFPFEQTLRAAAENFSLSVPFIDANTIVSTVHSSIVEFQKNLESMLQEFVTFSFTLFLVPFLTYFILADGNRVMKRCIEYVPNKYFEMTLNVLYKIKKDLKGYLKGWLLDSFIIGILSICGYFIIGIDFAITIGVIAGIANLIPYVGPIAGAVPAVLLSLTQYGDFQKLPDIILLTLLIQLLDNTFVQPYCFAKTVDMHPVTVIVVLLIGNTLMGVVGMLLAIPLATVLKASTLETYWGLKHYRITT